MAKVDPNPDAELTLEQHEQRLEAGWQWLERYPNRRDSQKNCDLWIKQLQAYQRHYTAIQRGTVPHTQGEMFETDQPRQAEWASL